MKVSKKWVSNKLNINIEFKQELQPLSPTQSNQCRNENGRPLHVHMFLDGEGSLIIQVHVITKS